MSTTTASPFLQGIRVSLKRQRQTPTIQPMPADTPIPLTLAQERLWWLDQMQPGNPAHTLRAIWRLSGPLNVAAFTQSLHEIERRHAILRTTFPASAGQPTQQISAHLPPELPVTDLRQLTTESQRGEVERLIAAATQQPFDLTSGRLIRCQLLRLTDDEFIFLRTIHHIITDAWSDSIFLRELAALYTALTTGQPPLLPDLTIQYADFAQWQRQQPQNDEFAGQLDYWQQQLHPAPALLQLPTDYLPTTAMHYAGGTEYRTLSPALIKSVGQWSQAQGVSPFVTLLAAFKTLLYLYSEQEDLLICSPVAGRSHPETKKLIGYFNNLVLLRTKIDPNATFQQVVSLLGRTVLDAFEQQDLALQQVAAAVNLPGALLSRAMFALQNVPSQPTHLGDVEVERLDQEEGISNFDLSLSLRKQADTLLAILRYKRDLFAQTTICQLLENYEALLARLVGQPEQRLVDLPRFTANRPAAVDNVGPSYAPIYVAPQNEQEQMLLSLWQGVLHQAAIGIDDHFFTLGGGSLAFVQLCQQLQTRLGYTIPMPTLLAAPTIRGMATALQPESATDQNNVHSLQARASKQKAALQQQKALRARRFNNE